MNRLGSLKNKRGGIGGFITQFVAIIVIAIILLVFVMMNGVWKKFTEQPAGMSYFGEDGSESSFFDYMSDGNKSLDEVKFVVAGGRNVNDAITEVSPKGVGGRW